MNADSSSAPEAAVLDVAVIGAGFSGRMLLAQLVRRHPRPAALALSLSDPRLDIAPGRAWDDASGLWSANVPAANLSAWPDRPDDFVDWWAQACTTDPADLRHAYAARATYGEYLREVWRQTLARSGAVVLELPLAVTTLTRHGAHWQLTHIDGRRLLARQVVLATGNPPPPPLAGQAAADPRILDPLDVEGMTTLSSGARVLILGSGLSAVDALQSLFQRRHRGSITLLSRHGLLPAAHAEVPAGRAEWDPKRLGDGARSALRAVRAMLRSGQDWRRVIDGLRPHTVALWRRWSTTERARFLRHLRAIWDVHRHRAAGVVHHQVFDGIAEHPVERLTGRLLRIDSVAAELQVQWQPRGSAAAATIACDIVVNATSASALQSPLLQSLLACGTVRADPLGLGLQLDDVGHSGEIGLHALGPLARARDWEATAIPELRLQAATLAQSLVETLL